MSDIERRLTCCLTFDLDGLALAFGGPDRTIGCKPNPQLMSRFEFGAVVGIPRVLTLLRERGTPATFFSTGEFAATYPDVIRRIHQEGHELGCHGWAHEAPVLLERSEELALLNKTYDAIKAATGEMPRGFRAPAFEPSMHTADLLLDNGFSYDSSLMARDFYPYFARTEDYWSEDDQAVFGQPTDLVELPVHWQLDDYPYFEAVETREPGNPRVVEQIWKDEFDYAYNNCTGGAYIVTLHPHIVGRGSRMNFLSRLVEYIADHEGVRFSTLVEVAEDWRKSAVDRQGR